MYSFMLVIFVIVCILLVLIILLQSSKASGMELFGGGSQNIFGAQTGDVLTKATTVLAALFLFGTIMLAIYRANEDTAISKKLKKSMKNQQNQPRPEERPLTGSTNPEAKKTNK